LSTRENIHLPGFRELLSACKAKGGMGSCDGALGFLGGCIGRGWLHQEHHTNPRDNCGRDGEVPPNKNTSKPAQPIANINRAALGKRQPDFKNIFDHKTADEEAERGEQEENSQERHFIFLFLA